MRLPTSDFSCVSEELSPPPGPFSEAVWEVVAEDGSSRVREEKNAMNNRKTTNPATPPKTTTMLPAHLSARMILNRKTGLNASRINQASRMARLLSRGK